MRFCRPGEHHAHVRTAFLFYLIFHADECRHGIRARDVDDQRNFALEIHLELSVSVMPSRRLSLTLAAFLNHFPVSVCSPSPFSRSRRNVAISVLTLGPGDGASGNDRPIATCRAVMGLMRAARSRELEAPVRNVAERPPMKLPRAYEAGRRNEVVA